MPWEADLQSLEAAIVRLNAEYDAFLYGSASRPPVETRKLVEKSIRRLNALEPDSAADRYRFTTLQGRYNALCERWDRLQNEKELGKRPGVYGGFVRESRRVGVSGPVPGAAGSAPPNAEAPSSVKKVIPKDQDAALFERYLAARKARGEDVRGYDLASFKQSLEKERQKLQARFGSLDVDFDVTEKDGRVKLVARRRGSTARGSGGGSEGNR
jgi:hypothetical protein